MNMVQSGIASPSLIEHGAPRPAVFGREVVLLGLAFAAALFVVSSLVWGLAGFDPVESALGKLVGIAGDATLAVLITLVLWRIEAWKLGAKALVACVLSLAAAPLSGLLDWAIHMVFVWPETVEFNPQYFAQVVIFTTSELFGWSCLYLALQYNARVRDSERRLAAVREEALSAKMQALQYQINPHFLFNTLNSIAGLVEENSSEAARDMVLGLSKFLRQTLTLDPLADLRLEDEIALQLDYLAIEKTRFSDRLTVSLQIDGRARDAKVPSLILQPLVENAIKHGVAKTPGPSVVVIGAEVSEAGVLHMWVENSAPKAEGHGGGMGIGLANVSNRLAARYGGLAECRVLWPGPTVIRAEVRMPFVL